MSELIQVSRPEEGIAFLGLDRAAKKNALSTGLRDEVPMRSGTSRPARW